jgi:hypothetical protein
MFTHWHRALERSHAGRMRRFVVAAVVSLVPVHALADGEATPMIGAAVVWSPTNEDPAGMLGISLEAAWWHGPVGLALEGSGRTHLAASDQPRAATVAASLRVRVFDWMTPSLMEPRDAEVGIEVQGIVERFWWEGIGAEDPDYGFGLAMRVRGGADDGSTRISESRFFLRVMEMPSMVDHGVARSTAPTPAATHELAVLFGIGASFGSGEKHYLDRFRWHAPEWPLAR